MPSKSRKSAGFWRESICAHIVFAQSEFVERDPAPIEVAQHFDCVFVVDFEEDAAVAPRAAQFGPAFAARFVPIAPVDGEIDIAEVLGRAGYGERIFRRARR